MGKSEEWAARFGLNTINYQSNRRKRAARLCSSLGGHAELSTSILPGAKVTYFSTFEEAVDDMTSVAVSKSIRFMIEGVMKSDNKWAVFYLTLDRVKSLC